MNKKVIYADDLLLAIRDDDMIDGKNFSIIRDHIKNAKAVEVLKVSHGHWNIDTSYMPFLSSCSECGAVYGIDGAFDWDYCPDCGSKMKGDKDENL